MMTPAEEVRRRHRQEGWNALTLPEQQWAVLDRIREPLKYGWLADQEAAEDLDRERKNLKPLKRKLPRACRGMAGYAKGELDRVAACTFDKLTRQERGVWKLMKRFHNDPQLLVDRRKVGPEGFDPEVAGMISASRGAAAPSRHRRDSCPSHNEVDGFFFEFEAVRTASRPRCSAQATRASSTRGPGPKKRENGRLSTKS
jgi:hypothetical protein